MADTRIYLHHCCRQVSKHFSTMDVELGRWCRCQPSCSRHFTKVTALRTATARCRHAYYAVPPEYLAREVVVPVGWLLGADLQRADANRSPCTPSRNRAASALHANTLPQERIKGTRSGYARLPGQGDHPACPHSQHAARAMIQARGVEEFVCSKVLSSAGRHPATGD